MSKEHVLFLRKIKIRNSYILITQFFIFIAFILIWEIFSNIKIINPFLTSSPSMILKTILNLLKQNNLFNHIFITVYEVVISFLLSTILGVIIASILWWNKFLSKVIEPYLTVINSLPKVALGPILIIWIGANTRSIIFMAPLISLIITIINIENAFNNTDDAKIKLMKSMNANKWQIYKMLVFPSNMNAVISCLKINISMSLIGVIMGELLVSKEGIGYLIIYGSQVFNLNLVMTGIILFLI